MHEIIYREYSYDTSKDKISESLNNIAIKNGDYHNRLYNPVRWIEDTVYPSYEAAEEAISRHDRRDYDNLAIPYFDTVADDPSEYARLRLTVIGKYDIALKTKGTPKYADAVKQWRIARDAFMTYCKGHTRTVKMWLTKIEYHV